MKKEIKETLEFLAGLRVVVPAGIQIVADGKLTAADVKPALEMCKKYDVVLEAVKGSGEIVAEAKDLDQVELAQIGLASVELFNECKAALAAGKVKA